MRVPSSHGAFTSAASSPSIKSEYTAPPQSFEIASTNFCPYPGEPRGLMITTPYPCDANIW